MKKLRKLSLIKDDNGTTVVEFAVISVPLLMMVFGAIDFGYQLFVRSIMQAATETAARSTTILDDTTVGNAATIETKMKTDIEKSLPKAATVTVTKGSYYKFGTINTMEPLTLDRNNNGVLDGKVDTDNDGVPDSGDCWTDYDDDDERNIVTDGKDGVGTADDLVRYTVVVTYTRLLPIWKMIPNMSDTVSMSTSTIVKRQPYKAQSSPKTKCT